MQSFAVDCLNSKAIFMQAPVLVGIPLDVNSSYLRGPADAPAKIREALANDASNQWSELGVSIEAAFEDLGNLTLGNTQESVDEDFRQLSASVNDLLVKGKIPLSLGGDHSITYPIIRAFKSHFPDLTIIHFDAHPDLYNEFEGSRLSHACPFARIMEERLAKRLVQIGIRTLNDHQYKQAEKFGVEIVPMAALPAYSFIKDPGPIYVSFDMDVLDPAFAPGVSHWEPGGMSVREAISHLHAINGKIVGADVVELNPTRDPLGISAAVAAKVVKEILGKILKN